MPYRDFQLPHNTVVRTRVSDEATLSWFLDWLDHRGTNGQHGRPPDIDTEFHRIWIGPKDDDSPHNVESHLVIDDQPLATLTQTVHYPGELLTRTVKILMGFKGERLLCSVRGQRHPGGETWLSGTTEFGPDEMDAANDMIQSTISELTEIADRTGAEYDWLMALPLYFEDFKLEHERAREELDAEVESRGRPREIEWSTKWEKIRTMKLATERQSSN